MSDEEPTHVSALMKRVGDLHARFGEYDDLDPVEADQLGVRTPEEHAALRWSAVIPQRFNAATLEDLAANEWAPRVVEWAARPDGRNLVLAGPVGCGKTHAAVAAVRPSFERGLSVLFVPAVELLDALRPGGAEGVLDDLLEADRLVIDDLGSERPSGWTVERLYLVVNRRWLDLRPTVVTTNMTGKQLAVELGDRMYSRLIGSAAVIVRMVGPDLRRHDA